MKAETVAESADRLLADITTVLVSEESPDRFLEAIADALRQLVPYDTLTIYRADPHRRLLHPVLVRDRWAEEIVALGPLEFGTGITGAAAESWVPELVQNVLEDPRAQQIPGTPLEREALIVVPLIAEHELKGTLNLYRLGEEARFEPHELSLAIRFGSLAAFSIQNAEIRVRLQNEVITDSLTGLYNHRYFFERLAEEMHRAHRVSLPLALLMLDIDDFKRANDRFGHLTGDRILQMLAAILRQCCRSEDVLCRTGGEEFGLILPTAEQESATAAGERIRAAVESHLFPEVGALTVSVGTAVAGLDGSTPVELFESADGALRRAKALGKNRVEASSPRAVGPHPPSGAPAIVHSAYTPLGSGVALRPLGSGGREDRAIGQLKVIHAVATRMNRLNEVDQIVEAITAELRTLIDYHGCWVYLLDSGDALAPIALQRHPGQDEGRAIVDPTARGGDGIAGRVVSSGAPLYLPDVGQSEFATSISPTSDPDMSVIAVPLRYGSRVIGAIVMTKFGIGQFDEGDLLLLEALASHAAIAMENARLYQSQKAAAEVAEGLLALSEKLTLVSDADLILNEALRSIPDLINCTAVEAWIRSERGDSYRLAAHHGYPPEMAAYLDELVVPASVADPFIGSNDQPFVIPKELLAMGPQEFRRWEGELDVLGTPMRWDPNGLGGIAIVARAGDYRFTERDIRVARGVSDITSLALSNAVRFRELERVYISTVEALAGALEAQDHYTSDHAHALADMATRVGTAIGLSEAELRELELAALFHDIGKIGVPSEIIRKPGPLRADERRIMNKHPEIGEQILAPVAFLDPIRPIVRACHERWDGKGYPDGLAGEMIPLAARIVFVCDSYHAMTSDRPYRRALPESEASRRLRRGAGRQFDPTVVDVFLNLREVAAASC